MSFTAMLIPTGPLAHRIVKTIRVSDFFLENMVTIFILKSYKNTIFKLLSTVILTGHNNLIINHE